ncbi:type IV pilus assembly protein PilP [Thiohalospira halophila DSM 15071]|uniref:Type IV pilus assembly protein PilP n=1 Tax=Thiohalospira halophila DSM 15071 TaxID=1123397 RepID=A0A1I1TC00_9GAMM|nr:pilus assembly protein PilP [Thiohalospira halophila]SFD56177.1 type IV pilus assembly protein PilP [Thiohalospira halophila DSM 15071]
MTRYRSILAALVVLLLGACADPDLEELEARMASMESEARGEVAPLPTLNEPDPPAFATEGRNPMERPGGSEAATPDGAEGPGPEDGRKPDPLESYSLEGLRMVGTMGSGERRVALVEDPEGRLHSVAEGDYMGRNHGRVERITATTIELREWEEASDGWQQRNNTVTRDHARNGQEP